MVVKSEYYAGQLSPTATQSIDGSPNSPTINGSGTLQQVNVTLEHSGPGILGGKDVKRSRFGVEYDGSSPEWCERIHRVNQSHAQNNYGSSRINITSYDGTSKVFGYYVLLDSDFDSKVNIVVENGSSSTTNYDCVILYDQ